MNRGHWKAMLPIITAFVEGKTVQFHNNLGWVDLNEFSYGRNAHTPDRYRIKPTPRLRPWKPEEVPVGSLVRPKGDPYIRCTIAAVDRVGAVVSAYPVPFKFQHLLGEFELLDGSPCGVEES